MNEIEGKKALFHTSPGGIILNSLWVPGRGGAHFILGQEDTKLGALDAVHRHVAHMTGESVPKYDAYDPSSYPWDWEEIPNRDIERTALRAAGGRTPLDLPMRSQYGVMSRPKSHLQVAVYDDDYATGKVPWTIRMTTDHDDLQETHNRLREYFDSLGNQRTSWNNFKVVR